MVSLFFLFLNILSLDLLYESWYFRDVWSGNSSIEKHPSKQPWAGVLENTWVNVLTYP